MTRKEVINVVNDVKSKLDTSVFSEEEGKKGKIGCNQFRELSSICRVAECYSEIELLVKYNEAKAQPGSSWGKNMKNNQTLAWCVIEGMEKIRSASDDEDCMNNLCLYFGYMYWYARIFAAENKNNNSDNKPNYSGGKNNNNKNNNNKYNNGGRRS